MKDILVFPAGTGEAISYAEKCLKCQDISFVYHPTPDLTHLLVDAPAKEIPMSLLERLPEKITVVGGNLDRPELFGYRKIDLLRDETYLARNAAITAECAVRVAYVHSKRILSGSSVLIIGWGRIGKCLAALLKCIGCRVTVAARKETDRSILDALGYSVEDPAVLKLLGRFDILFNTAPDMILDEAQLSGYPELLKIDLASRPGLGSRDVIWERGLPGRYAPESSGKLIAETFLKLCREGTS